jgi:hypothetical protein
MPFTLLPFHVVIKSPTLFYTAAQVPFANIRAFRHHIHMKNMRFVITLLALAFVQVWR